MGINNNFISNEETMELLKNYDIPYDKFVSALENNEIKTFYKDKDGTFKRIHIEKVNEDGSIDGYLFDD